MNYCEATVYYNPDGDVQPSHPNAKPGKCGLPASVKHHGVWYCGVHDPTERHSMSYVYDAIREAERKKAQGEK